MQVDVVWFIQPRPSKLGQNFAYYAGVMLFGVAATVMPKVVIVTLY